MTQKSVIAGSIIVSQGATFRVERIETRTG
jgi:hypothetical protein